MSQFPSPNVSYLFAKVMAGKPSVSGGLSRPSASGLCKKSQKNTKSLKQLQKSKKKKRKIQKTTKKKQTKKTQKSMSKSKNTARFN